MKKCLYVGLGNVGPAFDGTRHNLGAEALCAWLACTQEVPAHCLFPTTLMNNSGLAVAAYLKKTSVMAADMVVVHDDVELPLGEVVMSEGGSAKGHNGVRSIQKVLGTNDFQRLRLGVGRPPEGIVMSDFVLQKFLPEEREMVQEMIAGAVKVLSELTLENHPGSLGRATPPS